MTDADPVVFVVDDDPSVRKALARLLKTAGFRFETYASAEEFLRRLAPDVPACLILDMNLPGLNGMDLQRTLAKRNVRLPVIFLTGYGDIRLSVRAMKGGAADFLSKPFNPRELLSAVRHALAAQEETRQADADAAETRRRAAALSPREREVMALVVNGMLNKQAGSKLGVCEKTVKVHRARVMQKMGAESLAALVRMSEKIGVPPPRP